MRGAMFINRNLIGYMDTMEINITDLGPDLSKVYYTSPEKHEAFFLDKTEYSFKVKIGEHRTKTQ